MGWHRWLRLVYAWAPSLTPEQEEFDFFLILLLFVIFAATVFVGVLGNFTVFIFVSKKMCMIVWHLQPAAVQLCVEGPVFATIHKATYLPWNIVEYGKAA